MRRVVTHADVEQVARGGTLAIAVDAVVTPFALEQAEARQVTLARGEASAAASPSTIRQVTRQVIARLPDASPEVLEAVVAEVLAAAVGASGNDARAVEEVGPGIDYCQMCLEQERARSRTRAVLTTTGKNQKGIVARVTGRLAALGGDILDISQTLVGDYFTMIIVVDTGSLEVPFAAFKETLETEIHEMGLGCMMMHEDVVSSLHRI